MATITSAATGNASAGATWVGGVAPAAGDNISVLAAHTVTFDADRIIGDSSGTGIDGTLALKAAGPIVVSNGVKLTMRGNARNSDNVTFGEGSRLIFETPNSSTNWVWTNAGRADLGKRITFAGTTGSRILVESKFGGGFGWFNKASDVYPGCGLDAAYTDFVRIGGGTTTPAIFNQSNPDISRPGYLNLANCRFLNCGCIVVGGGSSTIYQNAAPATTEYGTFKLTNVQTIAGVGRGLADVGLSTTPLDFQAVFYPSSQGIAVTPANLGFDGCDFQGKPHLHCMPSNFPFASTIFRVGKSGWYESVSDPAGASAPWPYRAVTLDGPTGGANGVASSNFTVALAGTGTCTGTTGDITITPSAVGGGTFSPTTVTLNDANTSGTFTYTPASGGTKTISVAASSGLLVDRSTEYEVAAVATSYSLTGPPAPGTVPGTTDGPYVAGRPHTFTVNIPNGQSLPSPVTITPAGTDGTFSPTTVELSTGTPSATFTYTPAVSGAKTVSTTNNGGLTNPAAINLTMRRSYAETIAWWDAFVAQPNPWPSYGATFYATTAGYPAGDAGADYSNHYDPLNAFMRQKEYSGSSDFDAAIVAARYNWGEKYILPNNGQVQGWRRQIVGLVRDWERNGELTSLSAATAMAVVARPTGGGASPLNLQFSNAGEYVRENALLLGANLQGLRVGVTTPVQDSDGLSGVAAYAERVLSACDGPPLAAAHPLDPGDEISQNVAIQPFIAGIFIRYLIMYYQATGDSRIPAKLKAALDAIWDVTWYPNEESFPYYDRDRYPEYTDNREEDGQPIPNYWMLNQFLAPAYAWWARHATDPAEKETYRRRFEDIFRGAARSGLSTQKEYNEQFYWSLDGVAWRDQSITPFPAATTYTLTARVASCRANEPGIELVVALPANTSTAGHTAVEITPSDDGAGGSFLPTSILLHTDEPIGVFRYAPAAAKAGLTVRIEATNNKGLADPSFVTVSVTTVAPLPTGIVASTPTYQATKIGWSDSIMVSYAPAGAVSPRSLDYLGGLSVGVPWAAKSSTPGNFTLYPYEGVGMGNFANGRSPAGTILGAGVASYPMQYNMEPSTRHYPSETGILVKVVQAGFTSNTVTLTPGTAATALAIDGPSTVGVGETATFTITPNGPLENVTVGVGGVQTSNPVIVTLADDGAVGSFVPTTLTWTGLNDPKTVVYTPPGAGTYTITLTNDADPAVTNPSAWLLTVGEWMRKTWIYQSIRALRVRRGLPIPFKK